MKRAICSAVLVVLLAALASAAVAGVTTTIKPGQWVLRQQVGATIKDISRHASLDECAAAAPAAGPWRCDTSVQVTAVANCVDEKAPRIYLTQAEIDGQKYWELPESGWPLLADSTTEYVERTWLYVHNPAWPAGYPNCWVRGWEDPNLWRMNPAAEPGKVFMERVEPGMADIVLPNSVEPVYWPGEELT